MTRIALIADYDPASASHSATSAALRHAADRLKVEVSCAWVATPTLDDTMFDHFGAILIGPGSPYQDMEKVLSAIRFAREHAVPCLGTCGGFQHMVIEYARSMSLTFKAESRAADWYGSTSATEQYYCSMGVNPARVAELKSGPLQVSGSDAEGEVRVIELPEHPFFLGTLFLPQLRSLPGRPHPLITAFVRAAIKRGRTL
jgi:CTP synthase (UTP-ammonia lyase)